VVALPSESTSFDAATVVSMSEERRVAEAKGWFAERGYELIVHPVEHGGFFAPYMRFVSRGGTAAFTWGRTAVEAVEAAQAELEAQERRDQHG
jgi:hypothetical protein